IGIGGCGREHAIYDSGRPRPIHRVQDDFDGDADLNVLPEGWATQGQQHRQKERQSCLHDLKLLTFIANSLKPEPDPHADSIQSSPCRGWRPAPCCSWLPSWRDLARGTW